MSAAQYSILSPAGDKREGGHADVEVAGGALVLTPSAGGVLRVPFGHICSVTEPEPFLVRVTLADGNAIELSKLGVMRTQLLAELRDGRGDDAASAAAAVGEAAVFSCVSAGGGARGGRDGAARGSGGAACGSGDEAAGAGEPAEVRVYEDALLVIGAAGSERISFSFADAVRVRDYAVIVEVAGREPVILTRLGRRTGELAALLEERLREARGRTAAFLGSLLPGLGPMALREAAGLLRDGVAVPASTLDRIHPDLSSTLVQIATVPARRDAIAELARRTGLAIGFRQLVSVRQPAAGVTPWRDHAAAPHIGEHESPGGSFRPGLMGMMAAGVMSGEYGGGFGEFWAFRALGAGMNGRGLRPMAPRPDVTRGCLTPATEDLTALAVTGESPTVLAFVLGSRSGRVVYEVLNQPEPMTMVYRADGAGGLTAINRALNDAGFAMAQPGGQGGQGGPQVLGSLLIGQVPHDEQWQDRIAGLLGG